MLGNFQQSQLRIELEADGKAIADSLLKSVELRQWMSPQTILGNLPDTLAMGTVFTSKLGLIEIEHKVEKADDNSLLLLLSGGIDGYHEWYWGDGWVQSRLEGVSLLPLNLGQTLSLLRLRQHIESKVAKTAA